MTAARSAGNGPDSSRRRVAFRVAVRGRTGGGTWRLLAILASRPPVERTTPSARADGTWRLLSACVGSSGDRTRTGDLRIMRRPEGQGESRVSPWPITFYPNRSHLQAVSYRRKELRGIAVLPVRESGSHPVVESSGRAGPRRGRGRSRVRSSGRSPLSPASPAISARTTWIQAPAARGPGGPACPVEMEVASEQPGRPRPGGPGSALRRPGPSRRPGRRRSAARPPSATPWRSTRRPSHRTALRAEFEATQHVRRADVVLVAPDDQRPGHRLGQPANHAGDHLGGKVVGIDLALPKLERDARPLERPDCIGLGDRHDPPSSGTDRVEPPRIGPSRARPSRTTPAVSPTTSREPLPPAGGCFEGVGSAES